MVDSDLREAARGTKVFYFTENEVMYYICHGCSSHKALLHLLMMQIKTLEIELELQLEVVHVLGLTMIDQGTDGLSRGIWISLNHDSSPTPLYTQAVFDAVIYTPTLPPWVANICGDVSALPTLRHWDQPWKAELILHQFSLWLPPPTIAHQLVAHFLNLWFESLLDTSFTLIIP